jgi:hypothetical protein
MPTSVHTDPPNYQPYSSETGGWIGEDKAYFRNPETALPPCLLIDEPVAKSAGKAQLGYQRTNDETKKKQASRTQN